MKSLNNGMVDEIYYHAVDEIYYHAAFLKESLSVQIVFWQMGFFSAK